MSHGRANLAGLPIGDNPEIDRAVHGLFAGADCPGRLRPRSLALHHLGMRTTLCIAALLLGALAAPHAAAEERPTRGGFVGLGGGFLTGTANDDTGRTAGSWLGGGGFLRFGEEAVPGLTLGLEFLGGYGPGANDRYAVGFGGFVLQLTWRPFDSRPELVFLLGTGVGGGEIVPRNTVGADKYEGLVGGSIHELGVIYEFDLWRGESVIWGLAPGVRWWVVPTTADGEVWFQTFSLGVETTWYFGG